MISSHAVRPMPRDPNAGSATRGFGNVAFPKIVRSWHTYSVSSLQYELKTDFRYCRYRSGSSSIPALKSGSRPCKWRKNSLLNLNPLHNVFEREYAQCLWNCCRCRIILKLAASCYYNTACTTEQSVSAIGWGGWMPSTGSRSVKTCYADTQ